MFFGTLGDGNIIPKIAARFSAVDEILVLARMPVTDYSELRFCFENAASII